MKECKAARSPGRCAKATGAAEPEMEDVTRILEELDGGDERAVDRLLTAVYDELRRLAAHRIAHEKPGQTLQATALVHEAYMRLVGDVRTDWQGRAHFFSAAAEGMRRILVERARAKGRLKRGGDRERIDLDDANFTAKEDPVDLLDLDEALSRLADEDPVKAELVKLRFFTGMTIEEAARVLGISHATADRYWAYARAWLFNELKMDEDRA